MNALTKGIRVLGIDPADRCGWAHVDAAGQVRQGTWVLVGVDHHPGARLLELRARIRQLAHDHGIDVIATEDSGFGAGKFMLTIMARHNELLGIIKATAAELRLQPPILYVPASIKKFATDNGRADKEQMMRAHKTHFGIDAVDDNSADARFILEMARLGYAARAKSRQKRRRKTAVPKAPQQPNLFKK